MSDIAIKVEILSKRYRIGLKEGIVKVLMIGKRESFYKISRRRLG